MAVQFNIKVNTRLLDVKSAPVLEHTNPAYENDTDITALPFEDSSEIKNSESSQTLPDQSTSPDVTATQPNGSYRARPRYKKKLGSDGQIIPLQIPDGKKRWDRIPSPHPSISETEEKKEGIWFGIKPAFGDTNEVLSSKDNKDKKVVPAWQITDPSGNVTSGSSSPFPRSKSTSALRRGSSNWLSNEFEKDDATKSNTLRKCESSSKLRTRSVSPHRVRSREDSIGDDASISGTLSRPRRDSGNKLTVQPAQELSKPWAPAAQDTASAWADDSISTSSSTTDKSTERFRIDKPRSSDAFCDNVSKNDDQNSETSGAWGSQENSIVVPKSRHAGAKAKHFLQSKMQKGSKWIGEKIAARRGTKGVKESKGSDIELPLKNISELSEMSNGVQVNEEGPSQLPKVIIQNMADLEDGILEEDDAIGRQIGLVHRTNFEYKLGMSYGECEIAGMTSLSNENIILYNRVKNQIRVFSGDYQCRATCEVPPSRSMSGVSDTKVSLASGKQLLFCKVRSHKAEIKDEHITLKSRVHASARVDDFYFVVGDDKGQGIVYILTKVKDNVKSKVKTAILNKWKIIHTITSFQLEDLSAAVNICPDFKHSRVFISDSKYRKILTVTSNREVGIVTKVTWLPRGIAMVDGFLLVCNDTEHSICCLNTRGEILKTVIKGLHFNPAILTFMPLSRRLLISSLRSSKIRVYDIVKSDVVDTEV